MTRKSPYHHPVKGHTRSGAQVSHYERGKGRKPTMRMVMRPRLGNPDYTVTLFFDVGRESHRVPATTFTDAAQQGIRSLQTPKIPRRMKIRRTKK